MTQRLTTGTLTRLALVLVSLILSLWHFGPLEGTLVSLLLTVAGQVYLFGYLTARALGVLRESEDVVLRLIWIVACGLSVNIVLSAAARLLLVPVNAYVIGLHALMFLLSLVPAAVAPISLPQRKTVPLYLLLMIACIVFVGVGWQRNHIWMDGYEDQTLPVSLTDWWAHQTQPENVVSREIAETKTLSYWSSDGLTYVFASWVWTGGFSAVQLIWYALTPLFAGLVPLAHYALAYRATKRADTAAWATGIVLILALMTINNDPIYGGAWQFGQEAAFQLNTLRTFSTALLIPLVMFVFLSALRTPKVRLYLLTGMVILALALTHPRQLLALSAGLYAVVAVSWLVMPSRLKLRQVVLLGVAMLPSLLVPVWQYLGTVRGALSSESLSGLSATIQTEAGVIEPSALLFNPLIALAVVLSLVSVVRLRRSLAAQFIFATALVMFVISYFPPILNSILHLLNSYFGLHLVLELFYIVPYGLILGIAIAFVHDQLARRVRLHISIGNWLIAGSFALVALTLLIEPFPMIETARDQIAAANDEQAFRDVHPFDEALLNRLRALPVTSDKVVFLTSNRLASYVIESVPSAFATGGRVESNPAIDGSTRFFESPDAPWLDAADVAFLQQYAVDYLVLSADNTRVPQLLLQPERFEWMDTVAGYLIFHVQDVGMITAVDRDFAEMNALYQAEPNPRWGIGGFHLDREPDAAVWQPMITMWREQLDSDPANDLARYGLAFASLMAGESRDDLWASLSQAHPDIFALMDAQAQVLTEQGQAQAAATLLLGKLGSAAASQNVLAARALLTESFFHLLTSEQLDAILALEDSDPAAWTQLMEWANANPLRTDGKVLELNANNVRTRATLLMSVERLDTAERWLSQIAGAETSPGDLVARAGLQLVHGNIDAARALLRPATDIDWLRVRFNLHRERWSQQPSAAAQLYRNLSPTADADPSPRLIAETGQLFAMQPNVEQRGSLLQVSVTLGNFAPTLPPGSISVQVTSPDGATVYGQAELATDVPLGALQRVTVAVDLAPDLPAGTPVLVTITPRYSDTVAYPPLLVQAQLLNATSAD